MKAIIDCRTRNKNIDETIEAVEYLQALSLLDQLDGDKRTLLSLYRDDGANLMIGGGRRDFVVTLINHSGQCFTLVRMDDMVDQEKLVKVCAGGQFAEFRENIVVKKAEAIEAIKNFYDRTESQLNLTAD